MTVYELVTPQFDRTDGLVPAQAPKTVEDYVALKGMSREQRLALGMQEWSLGLWLFPFEWFDHIPEGLEVTDIFMENEKFSVETSGQDKRFGALPFGIFYPEEFETGFKHAYTDCLKHSCPGEAYYFVHDSLRVLRSSKSKELLSWALDSLEQLPPNPGYDPSPERKARILCELKSCLAGCEG